MSSPVVVLEPVPAAGIKSCEPNLMPFHISYSGPALISTFMQVKPAKEEGSETPAEQGQTEEAEDSSTETKEDAAQKSTEVKEAAEDNTAVAMDVDVPPEGQATLNSTRAVSTFRGRIIQSLKVDLPEGYGGLVLQAPPPQTTTAPLPPEPSTVASGSKAKSNVTQEDAADDDEFPTARSTRRRGRLARSAVPTKVVDIDKEEEVEKKKRAKPTEGIDVDAEPSPAMDVDAAGLDTSSPQRRLKPVAQFSSFTIWHPDNPVVELQDEYYRSVHEWTALAAVLHQCDDEE